VAPADPAAPDDAPATIRPATPNDADAISDAHIRGWQVAYRGIVPDAVLDGMAMDRRIAWWRTYLAERAADDPARAWVIETASEGVVGFAHAGAARDESAVPPEGAGEVYAIYLRPECRRRGLGRALFAHTVTDLVERDFDPLVVWVLEANADTCHFYEAAGFEADGARHDIDFAGDVVPEVRYRRAARPGPA